MENAAQILELPTPSALRMESAEDESKEALMSEIIRLRQYIKDLERAADTDPLVPVFNRRAFLRELSRAQSVFQRYSISTSVLYLDLNGFKSVNDRFGHAMGDEILMNVGRVLQENVRDCDLVARLGGDEFGVLLFKTEEKSARAKAAKLVKFLNEIQIDLPTSAIHVSATWGVAQVSHGITPERILSEADEDMYQNKRHRRIVSN